MKTLPIVFATVCLAYGQQPGSPEHQQRLEAEAFEQRVQSAAAARLGIGPPEAVIVPVKTLTGDSFDRLVRMLKVFDVKYEADSQLRTILIYGPKKVTDQMRRVIEELDKPGSEAAIGHNVEMTLTLLRCSTKANAAASVLPPEIEAVAKQLRAATQYKDIQLWDVIPIRLQEGKDTSETLRLPGGPHDSMFMAIANIRIHPEAVGNKAQGRYVRFSRLQVDFKLPIPSGGTNYSYLDVGLQTAGDFFEGQKTVLGKVSGMEDETAIFAVIALRILD